jgi:hypothetical protein
VTIQPALLTAQRGQLSSEALRVWLRLDRVVPGWWASLTELAAEIQIHRSSLVRGLAELETAGLVRRDGRTNMGLWVWWVKRWQGERPDLSQRPVWLIRDRVSVRRNLVRVPVGELNAWGEQRGVPRKTVNSWMGGRQRWLRHRWEIVASPGQEMVGSDNEN